MTAMGDTRRIRISDGATAVVAVLNSSDTATAVWDALPFSGRAQCWGDEIYFAIPVSAQLGTHASDVVDVGTVAFWPPGNAMCLFWGPTPASVGDECRAASPVSVIGSIEGDAGALAQMRPGAELTVAEER